MPRRTNDTYLLILLSPPTELRRSEGQLHAELELAWIELAEHLAEGWIVQDAPHQIQVRMVQRVEELGAELQIKSFLEAEMTDHHRVYVRKCRSDDGVAA